MISKGYVGILSHPINQTRMLNILHHWIERFEKIEQLIPGDIQGTSALSIQKEEDLMWHKSMEFRVSQGSEFAWVYITAESKAIETTGLPSDQISVCLEVLLELPDLVEVIDEHDEKRLCELEKIGVL